MKNRVMYRKDWAEIGLVGSRGFLAKVDFVDLPKIEGFRWGWHPRGVFDHGQNKLLTHVLFPQAKQVFFRNRSLLDCRRENLFTGDDVGAVMQFRRRNVSGVRGVYYDAERCAYIAHYAFRGVKVFGYFRVKDYPSARDAEGAAERQRAEFLTMSIAQLSAWKQRRAVMTEDETWLGEDVARALATTMPRDPEAALVKSFQAGLMAHRVLVRDTDVPATYRHNGREVVMA